MKDQAFNPYLPNWEYVPDGEPHEFDGRIYVYGSHDRFDGSSFCLNDYVCWSCPSDDLSDWRYEGVIFRKTDDPKNKRRRKPLYAPDVCRGADGKYYLYYFVMFDGVIGVARCDTPCGRFEHIGYVRHTDGTLYGKKKGDIFQFDPAVYAEDGKTYLYTGFAPVHFPFFLTGGKPITRKGPMCAELDADMLTVKRADYIGVECKRSGKGTPYEGHEFFEAASMRKINGRYYFIYSSYLGHELCYAVSDRPDGGFEYGGTIVSIGDVGLRGIKGVKDAANFCGNTHGSICRDAYGNHYIFYHRQTNRHCFSRQGCAERIDVAPDGHIQQTEVTSCGLNGRPLVGLGEYPATIACNITCKKGGKFYWVFKTRGRPYLTQSGGDREDRPDQYVANVRDGTCVGFKYFDLSCGESSISVRVRGNADGMLTVSDGTKTVAEIPIALRRGAESEFSARLAADGVKPLFFEYGGSGKLDLMSFRLEKSV